MNKSGQRPGWVAAAAALLAASACLAQAPAPSRGVDLPPARQRTGAYRNPVPVTDPARGGQSAGPFVPRTLEYIVQERQATLHRDDQAGWWVLDMLPMAGQADLPPHRVLPSGMLAAMEQANGAGPVTFIVSGQSTRYRGEQYILVNDVLAMDAPPPAPPLQAAGSGTVAPAGGPVSPAELSAIAPAGQADGSAAAILGRMMQDVPAKPVLAAPEDDVEVAAAPSVAPGASRLASQPDRGDMMIDRLGFILPSKSMGGWYEFHFVSDNTLGESPLLILPSLLLQRNQSLPRKVRMSGEVVRYRGRAYLVLRKLLAQRNMDQF